jgi:hypothetical protein
MWEPDLQWYAEAEKLERELRSVAMLAGDHNETVPNWIREMREERRMLDDQMVRLCKRQRVLQVVWVIAVVLAISLPYLLLLVRR